MASMATSTAASSNPSPQSTARQSRDWLELPHDMVSMILSKLDIVDILNNAQNVCTSWRSLCMDPLMWRRIHISYVGTNWYLGLNEAMFRQAVDWSSGQLVAIYFEYYGTNEMLKYVTDSTSQLECLQLVGCSNITDMGMIEAAPKLPLLVELELCFYSISNNSLEAIGRNCPLLKSLKLNSPDSRFTKSDVEAFAIAENMPNLHHLQISENHLTDDGLQAILNGCPHLESLDLRRCFNLYLHGDLRKRVEQIKQVRLPEDSKDDYELKDRCDYGNINDSDFDPTYDYNDYCTSEFSGSDSVFDSEYSDLEEYFI